MQLGFVAEFKSIVAFIKINLDYGNTGSAFVKTFPCIRRLNSDPFEYFRRGIILQ